MKFLFNLQIRGALHDQKLKMIGMKELKIEHVLKEKIKHAPNQERALLPPWLVYAQS